MKKLLFFLGMSFLSIITFAQAPEWLLAKIAGGNNKYEEYSNASSITTDYAGNIYVVGNYNNFVSFDSISLPTIGSNIFLSKFNANSDVLWAKSINGNGSKEAYSVTTDNVGNIYITGCFTNTLIFDSITLIDTGGDDGYSDIFLAKFDTNGNVLWAKKAGGPKFDEAHSVTTDISGNVYITGWFYSDTVFFDTNKIINSGYNSTYSSLDVFLVKYNANGNVIWAKGGEGEKSEYAHSITTDTFGNIYMAGSFYSETLRFDSCEITNTYSTYSHYDVFLVKYNANGNVLWAKSAGGTNSDGANAITVDSKGNIYVAGHFYSHSISFGPTTLINSNSQCVYPDIFLVKYDSNANFLWAKGAGGNEEDIINSIVTDVSGNVYVAGYYCSHNICFGPNAFLSHIGTSRDFFLVKYNNCGNAIWAKNARCGNNFEDSFVEINILGDIFVTGSFTGSFVTFDSFTLTKKYISPCVFLAKTNNNIGINKSFYPFKINLYPNPVNNKLTIEIPQKIITNVIKIRILNIQGQPMKIISTVNNKTLIDISSFPIGVYFVEVETKKAIIFKKFIKI